MASSSDQDVVQRGSMRAAGAASKEIPSTRLKSEHNFIAATSSSSGPEASPKYGFSEVGRILLSSTMLGSDRAVEATRVHVGSQGTKGNSHTFAASSSTASPHAFQPSPMKKCYVLEEESIDPPTADAGKKRKKKKKRSLQPIEDSSRLLRIELERFLRLTQTDIMSIETELRRLRDVNDALESASQGRPPSASTSSSSSPSNPTRNLTRDHDHHHHPVDSGHHLSVARRLLKTNEVVSQGRPSSVVEEAPSHIQMMKRWITPKESEYDSDSTTASLSGTAAPQSAAEHSQDVRSMLAKIYGKSRQEHSKSEEDALGGASRVGREFLRQSLARTSSNDE